MPEYTPEQIELAIKQCTDLIDRLLLRENRTVVEIHKACQDIFETLNYKKVQSDQVPQPSSQGIAPMEPAGPPDAVFEALARLASIDASLDPEQVAGPGELHVTAPTPPASRLDRLEGLHRHDVRYTNADRYEGPEGRPINAKAQYPLDPEECTGPGEGYSALDEENELNLAFIQAYVQSFIR